MFNFITTSALFFFILSGLVAFSARTHILLLSIPYFFIVKTKLLFSRNKSSIIIGRVLDKDAKNPVSKANVYIIDAKENKILNHLKTNKLGEFYFKKPISENYKISVMKKGFSQSPNLEYTNQTIDVLPLAIGIEKDKTLKHNLFEISLMYAEDLIGILLEFTLVTALVVEIFFYYIFGFGKIAPFLLISTSNIILFFLFIYKPRKLEIKE